MNAKVMVREIQSQLSSIDPKCAQYESNAQKTEARLDELLTEIKGEPPHYKAVNSSLFMTHISTLKTGSG